MSSRRHARAATLLILALVTMARAEVRDHAKFFSEDAVRQANFDLRDVKAKLGKDLLIETQPAVPADMQPQLRQLGEDAFFEQWARQVAQEAKVDGAAVLITKDPSHLHVVVGDKTRQKAFTLNDRDALRDQLLAAFREKKYDEGLLGAVRTFRQTLSTNLGSGGAPAAGPVERAPGRTPAARSDQPQPNPGAFEPRGQDAPNRGAGGGGTSFWQLLIWGIIIFIVVRVVLRLFRRRTAPQQGGGMFGQPGGFGGFGRRRYGHDPRYGGGGTGGFGTGLGGGLLGGLLGGWLGGRIFGGDQNAAHGAPPPTSSGGTEPGVFSSEHDSQFAGSGGTFGDAGGGGDFGGDAGGDSGGGGDF